MPGKRRERVVPREVQVSKCLSYLLRHGAGEEGVGVDEGGWANVGAVLRWSRIASLKVDLPELQAIVATNEKKRYLLEREPAGPQRADPNKSSSTSSLTPADWRIRASQGHSITTISNEKIFKPILLTDADCPDFVVHGTDNLPWEQIKRSGGLKPMGRKHIHFATKLIEEKIPPLNRDFQSLSKPPEEELDKVISGMRRTSTVMIWVDVKKSLREGVEWWRSDNGVVLTEGVGEPRMLGFEWIRWVETRRNPNSTILYGEKVESDEVGEMERRMERLGVGEGVTRDEVDGGKVSQGGVNGETELRENEVDGTKKLETNTAVKDNWDD